MKTSKSVHIAIDLGASSGRVICGVYQQNNLKIYEVHRFKNIPINIDGLISWDIKYIYKNILIGINIATKIYAEMTGNILQDTPSSQKYWHFIKY